jgi:hypothetical protein
MGGPSVETMLRVTDVKPIDDRHLKVTFNDGVVREIDCPFLSVWSTEGGQRGRREAPAPVAVGQPLGRCLSLRRCRRRSRRPPCTG